MNSLSGENTADYIAKKANKVRSKASEYLANDLQKMVNNPDFSDVVFVCKDDIRVHASQMILRGRSEVIRSMIRAAAQVKVPKEVSEITYSCEFPEPIQVPLPEFSSPTVISCFEFLYTGDIVGSRPENWTMGLAIIAAAHFFGLDKLHFLVWEILLSKTDLLVINLAETARTLNHLLEFQVIYNAKMSRKYVLPQLIKALSSRILNPVELQKLHEGTFRYLLLNTTRDREEWESTGETLQEERSDNEELGPIQSSTSDLYSLSFTPYLQLRQVILWCACLQISNSHEVEQSVNAIVPDAETATSFWTERHTARTVDELDSWSKNHAAHFKSIFPDRPSAERCSSLLSSIDLRSIHPLLLLKVVEPLKLVSAENLITALEFNALRVPMKVNMPRSWYHSRAYDISDDGLTIQKVDPGIALAVSQLTLSALSREYVWSITVQEITQDFLEIGFFAIVTGSQPAKKPNFDQPLSEQPLATVVRYEKVGDEVSTNMSVPDDVSVKNWLPCERKVQQGSEIRFHFNTSNRSSCIFIDGAKEPAIWADITDAIYHPAVCLGASQEGCVQIVFIDGFDSL